MSLPDPSASGEYTSRFPLVPPYVINRYGMRVETTGTRWFAHELSSRQWIDWTKAPMTGELLHCFKLYICDRLERASPAEVINAFNEIRYVLVLHSTVLANCEELSEEVFVGLRQRLRELRKEWRLSRLRHWFIWMADLELPGISQELSLTLLRWKIPGNPKGIAVMSMDPDSGPLSDSEDITLRRAMANVQVPSQELGAVMLCRELGANPKNLILLEERDLLQFLNRETGETTYQLTVPRIKKRQDTRLVKQRAISPELGRILTALIGNNHIRFGGPDPKRPIFCRRKKDKRLNGTSLEKRFSFHLETVTFTELVRRFAKKHSVVSPITGNVIHLTPRRLRYTFATRMAIQGTPPRVLAELLDDTDLQHVMVYIDTRSAVVDRLDKAMELSAGPVWSRFLGKIVGSEDDAVPKADPGARIYAKLGGGIGTCGKLTLCNLFPPYSCYVCTHFQAWKQGPHEEELAAAEARREELRTRANGPSDRMFRQLDEVIEAMRDVVGRIKNGE